MIVRIQLQDANGQPLQGVSVEVTGCGSEPAMSGADGLTQFLTDDDIPTVTITIGGTAAWTGPSAELRKSEVFQQSASGFARK